jgi:hypothetical protein
VTYFRRLPFIETTFCALANASSRATLLLGLAAERIAASSFRDSHICACSGCDAAVCTGKLNSSERARSVGESTHSNVPAVAPPLAARASPRSVEPSSGLGAHLPHSRRRTGLQARPAKRLCLVNVRKLFQQLPIFQVVFPFSRHPISAGLSHFVQVDDVRAHSSAPSVVFQP